MKATFKATGSFLDDVRKDLSRPHKFAAERVGFISVHAASAKDNLILIAQAYHPLADEDYINDMSVGAMMGQEAIRKALNVALLGSSGMFHIHMHEHRGRPSFSRTDLREQLKFVPDFFKVRPQMPHGAIVLSHNLAAGRTWLGPETVIAISEFATVAPNMRIDVGRSGGKVDFTA